MPRYTLHPPDFTATITSRCPVCLTTTYHNKQKALEPRQLFLHELCCSEECAQIWAEKLITIQTLSEPRQEAVDWYIKNIECGCLSYTMQEYIESHLT